MLNICTIMGRLTRDPELRYTADGTPVATFTLACDRDTVDKASGQRATDFIDCVAWRKSAEFISKYFSKGQMMAVNGRLQFRTWEDKDGNKRKSAEIKITDAFFGEARKATPNSADTAPASSPFSGFVDATGFDDGLPF